PARSRGAHGSARALAAAGPGRSAARAHRAFRSAARRRPPGRGNGTRAERSRLSGRRGHEPAPAPRPRRLGGRADRASAGPGGRGFLGDARARREPLLAAVRYESRHQPLLPRRMFLLRVWGHSLVALGIIGGALVVGVIGYHAWGGLGWLDS